MFDAGQVRPAQTGEVTETQTPAHPTAPQKATDKAADVSALATADGLKHTPQQRATLEHEVRFEDGQAVTKPQPTPTSGGGETTTTPPSGGGETTTTPTAGGGETTTPAAFPEALQDLDQDMLALITEALNACRDQNYKSALDVIDSAIAAHRKMLEASERQHRQQAPIQAARRQAEALRQLQADVIQQQASQKAADSRRLAP